MQDEEKYKWLTHRRWERALKALEREVDAIQREEPENPTEDYDTWQGALTCLLIDLIRMEKRGVEYYPPADPSEKREQIDVAAAHEMAQLYFANGGE